MVKRETVQIVVMKRTRIAQIFTLLIGGRVPHCLAYRRQGVVEARQEIPGVGQWLGEQRHREGAKEKEEIGMAVFVLVVDCLFHVIIVALNCVG